MKRGVSGSAGFISFLVLFLAHAHIRLCAQSISTILPLPSLGGSMMQVNGLNSAGQITGFSYTTGNLAAHAFLYSNGSMNDLGTLGGAVSQGLALNSSGQVVGQADLGDFVQTHAFLYTGTNLLDLQTLGGSYSGASFVNDAGQVVGQSLTDGDAMMVWFLYSNGSMTNIGDLGGGDTTVAALNESGQIVGDSYNENFEDHAFLYLNGAMQDLGTLGAAYSAAFALNDAGMVVGESTLTSGETHAFACVGGNMADLGTVGGTTSQAIAVNNAGQVIGTSTTPSDTFTHGFIYSSGPMTDLGTLGGGDSYAYAINNKGQVVGEAALDDADLETHAFLWQSGAMVDLNSLLPENSGWVLGNALFINDSGRIVGTGSYNGGSSWFMLDLGTANGTPVAVAGPDQTVECPAPVTLDGSASHDPNGGALAFEWSENGAVFATQAMVVVSFPLGVHDVTLKVTNPLGASSQTNVTIRVMDTTSPTIVSGPGPITLYLDANCQAAVPNVLSGVVATDNCTPTDQLVLTQVPAAGTAVGAGQQTIVVTVTDASGNAANTNVLFTVADTMAPSIVRTPGPITLYLDANCQAAVPNVLSGVVATDNCTPTDQLVLTQVPVAGTAVGAGQQSIVVTVADASGNTANANVLFTVADSTPPSIVSIPSPVTLSLDSHCQAAVPNVLPNIVAADNCTPANQLVLTQVPAAGTAVGAGQHTIVVTATDATGNTANANVLFTVADSTPPSIVSTPGIITISLSASCQAAVPNVLSGIVAADNCTPATQLVMTQDPAAGTIVGTGQHTIAVTVSDAAGNSANANVLLKVLDSAPPSIQSVTASPNVLSPPNHQMVPVNLTVVASDDCDIAPVSKIISVTCNESSAPADLQLTGNLTLNLAASRNPGGPGRIYAVTVECRDASGNASTRSVTVTVPKGNGK
jgi:probable HAF family extracellular repeat protein